MWSEHNRAFKEWAVSCEALEEGKQTLLIRKGGVREEGGVFVLNDPEFFLMRTYEHQKAELLQERYAARLQQMQETPHDYRQTVLSAYAVVDTIYEARTDEQVNALAPEHIWNPTFVRNRFDYNPYDPLYLVLLRVYRLSEPVTLPMSPAYEGCKSWVTLDRCLSTEGATPALSDSEFASRRSALLDLLT